MPVPGEQFHYVLSRGRIHQAIQKAALVHQPLRVLIAVAEFRLEEGRLLFEVSIQIQFEFLDLKKCIGQRLKIGRFV